MVRHGRSARHGKPRGPTHAWDKARRHLCPTGTFVLCPTHDGRYHRNDGLVNTLSARAPFGAPQRPLDRSCIERGVWNVMPDLQVDHGCFQGGFIKKQDPQPFFQDLLDLLQSLD